MSRYSYLPTKNAYIMPQLIFQVCRVMRSDSVELLAYYLVNFRRTHNNTCYEDLAEKQYLRLHPLLSAGH